MTDNIRTNFCVTCKEQADRIEAPAAEIERLREALGKLAPMVDWMPHPDCVEAEQIIRAALGETE
jgi:hypothetical protein